MISRSHWPARFTIVSTPLAGVTQPGFIGSCVPTGTAIGVASPSQPASSCIPVGKSMKASARDSGIGASHDVVPSPAITRAHTGSAPEDPVNPVGRLSSYPTQTTTRCDPENPANQLSRRSDEVPDFPATTRFAGNSERPGL